MHLCERAVEAHVQRTLAIPGIVGISSALPAGDVALTVREQLRYDTVRKTPRVSSWLAGRSALKRVLSTLGESTDTSELVFPHARLSLTHSGGYAVAVGVSKNVELLGIGIDFETTKQLHPEGDRFFLTTSECDWIRSCPAYHQAEARLRLWTVKEALFKAKSENAGSVLLDYQVTNPSAHTGTGNVRSSRAVRFSYSSLPVAEGILSVAVSQPQEVLT